MIEMMFISLPAHAKLIDTRGKVSGQTIMDNQILDKLALQAKTDKLKFRELYDYIYPLLLYYFKSKVEHEAAIDMVHDCIYTVYEKIDRFSTQKGSFKAWIYTIARNCFKDYLKKNKNDYSLDLLNSIDLPVYEGLGALELAQLHQIKKHVQLLPDQMKRILEMKYYWLLRNKDIAEELNIKEKSVSSQIVRAVAKLEQLLRYKEAEHV